jgi:two-component system chemotaxis response regulator CheB
VAFETGAPPDRVAGLLTSDASVQLACAPTAAADAVRAVRRWRPDVVVMALAGNGGPGVAAIAAIMANEPVPVVACASAEARGPGDARAAALGAGALAAIDLSPGAAPLLVQTVKNMAAVRVIRRRSKLAAPRSESGPGRNAGRRPRLVAVGSSTGGPQALAQILTRLPASFPVPVLVVQHIDAEFTHSLVEWLDPLCDLPVLLGTAGRPVHAPGIVFAPPDRHLELRAGRVALSDAPPVSGHRPSAGVLFASVARECGPDAVGVLLTGMGDDGAAGLRTMREAGAITIAQDEATSVVYGMPRAAVTLGAASHVLAPPEIAGLLVDLAACGD